MPSEVQSNTNSYNSSTDCRVNSNDYGFYDKFSLTFLKNLMRMFIDYMNR